MSPEQVFFALLCCWLDRYGIFKQILCPKLQLIKVLGLVFNGDQEKKLCRIF